MRGVRMRGGCVKHALFMREACGIVSNINTRRMRNFAKNSAK